MRMDVENGRPHAAQAGAFPSCLARAPEPISEPAPVFHIRGKRHGLMAQAIARIPGCELKRAAASVAEQRDRSARARDRLPVGF
jgi:hypothetical protein